jgi:hypothetical protein
MPGVQDSGLRPDGINLKFESLFFFHSPFLLLYAGPTVARMPKKFAINMSDPIVKLLSRLSTGGTSISDEAMMRRINAEIDEAGAVDGLSKITRDQLNSKTGTREESRTTACPSLGFWRRAYTLKGVLRVEYFVVTESERASALIKYSMTPRLFLDPHPQFHSLRPLRNQSTDTKARRISIFPHPPRCLQVRRSPLLEARAFLSSTRCRELCVRLRRHCARLGRHCRRSGRGSAPRLAPCYNLWSETPGMLGRV